MKVLRGLPDSPDPALAGGAVTWGVFDGVHRGHRRVVETLVSWARELGAPSLVVTFDRHPAEVLRGTPVPLVCPLDVRVERLGALGADAVVILPFTVEFSRTPADEFVRGVIRDRLGARAVLLGHDSHFGRNRAGDFALLENVAGDLGLLVRNIEPELLDGRPLSSSRVREALAEGRLDVAAGVLGRPFAAYGTVEKGDGRGSTIGVPTANVRSDGILPKEGVYRVEVPLDGRTWAGAANLGRRPTFKSGEPAATLEVHLLGYAGPPLLGRRLEVRFLDRIRDERKFAGPEELVRQIRADLDQVRQRASTS